MSDIPLTKQPSKWRLRWVIGKNEVWNILSHPAYLVLLILPIFMNLVFGIMMGALQGPDDLIVVVYDQGKSSWITELNEIPDIEWQFVNSEAAVLEAIEEEATGGLIIPADFDTAVSSGTPPDLLAYINMDASRGKMIRFREALINQIWAISYQDAPATIIWNEENVDEGRFADFSVETYMTVMFIILGVTLTVVNISPQLLIEARESGVFSMLLASPVEVTDMLFGQSFATLLFSLLVSITLLFINMANIHNWLWSFVVIFLLAVVLNGLGLILGLIPGNKAQCNTYTAVAGILLIIPVWFFVVSVDDLSPIVSGLLQLTPTYHFGIVFTHILSESASFNTIWLDVLVLMLFGVLFYSIAHVLSKRPLTTI